MAKNKGHDYSTLLIWAAALVTVVRYSAAFVASDMGQITGVLSDIITVLMGISGLGMGILDVIGGTYLFDGWRRNMPATGKAWSFRFKMLTAFVFCLMATGVMILVPFTVSRVTHESMEGVLGTGEYLTWWAFLVNVAPYLLIGGVAIGNQVVSVGGGPMSGQMTEPSAPIGQLSGQLTGNFPTDWRKVRKLLKPDDIAALAKMNTEEICYKYGVIDRTARRWRENAHAEIQSMEKKR